MILLSRQIPEPPHYYNTQPVLVLLHAGTWLAGGGGDGLFQPDYMIESDVTVVTINHRLGPFGEALTDELVLGERQTDKQTDKRTCRASQTYR